MACNREQVSVGLTNRVLSHFVSCFKKMVVSRKLIFWFE